MVDIGLETGLGLADIELDCIGLENFDIGLDFRLKTGSETDNIRLHISSWIIVTWDRTRWR